VCSYQVPRAFRECELERVEDTLHTASGGSRGGKEEKEREREREREREGDREKEEGGGG